jgi:hypothetical protein
MGALHWVHSAFSAADLKKVENSFFRIYENALEICIFLILALNWMKQVFLGFFGVYLQVKNIACQVCDNFLYSFISFLKMLLIFRNA